MPSSLDYGILREEEEVPGLRSVKPGTRASWYSVLASISPKLAVVSRGNLVAVSSRHVASENLEVVQRSILIEAVDVSHEIRYTCEQQPK